MGFGKKTMKSIASIVLPKICKVGILLIIAILTSSLKVFAQKLNYKKHNSKDIPPHLIDTSGLKRDIICQTDLDGVLDDLKKGKTQTIYMYHFYVSTKGMVEPQLIYNENDTLFLQLNSYVKNTFNNYKWIPGHKGNCKSCLQSSFMELSIFFQTDSAKSGVELQLTMLKLYNPVIIYSEFIPYSKLSTLKSKSDCSAVKNKSN